MMSKRIGQWSVSLLLIVLMLMQLPMAVSAQGLSDGYAAAGEVAVASECLKDNWHVYLDKSDVGEKEEWFKGFPGEGTVVSLPHSTSNEGSSPIIWMGHTFVPSVLPSDGQRAMLRFEGCRYYARVWLNGVLLGDHEGSTGAFAFDVTDIIRPEQENLIAIQLFSPVGTATLRGLDASQLPTTLSVSQFVQTPVYLSIVPEVAIADAYVYADYQTSTAFVHVTLDNPAQEEVSVAIAANLSAQNGGAVLVEDQITVKAAVGLSEHIVELKLENMHPWSPDDPYLYRALVQTRAEEAAYADSKAMMIGFKDFRIDEDGYFRLNGERIFVKCLHTQPIVTNKNNSTLVGDDLDGHYRQMDFFKAAGYNMVRFIAGPTIPEVLDYCDRIGLMVYQEQGLAWRREGSSESAAIMNREIRQLLERDRSHASFAMIGILNETNDMKDGHYDQLIDEAQQTLGTVREYYENILVMFSSGRWDYDITQASASNPGSTTWDVYLCDEGTDAESNPIFQGLGDIHYYPRMPYNAEIRNNFAQLGGVNATFLSEAGAGSWPNIIGSVRTKQQIREGNYSVAGWLSRQISSFEAYYKQYNMAAAYATPESAIHYSQVMSARQRNLFFDYIRSNGTVSGYSMTQAIDVNQAGEGVLEETLDYKSGLYDTLVEGWQDMRICLNIDHYNIYQDGTLDIDAYLSDLTMTEADLTVTARVIGDKGTVWSKTIDLTVDGKGYTTPILKESVSAAQWEGGEYRLSMEINGMPIDAVKTFWVNEREDLPRLSGTIYVHGLSDVGIDFLKKQGMTVQALDENAIVPNSTILLAGKNMKNRTLKAIYESVKETGTRVIGLNARAFGDWGFSNLPFVAQVSYSYCDNWLYHFDSYICESEIFDGLPSQCMLDAVYFEDVYPQYYFAGLPAEKQMHVMTMFLGNSGTTTQAAMRFGAQIVTEEWGEGEILLNTFEIADAIGTPVADRLLCNMILSMTA